MSQCVIVMLSSLQVAFPFSQPTQLLGRATLLMALGAEKHVHLRVKTTLSSLYSPAATLSGSLSPSKEDTLYGDKVTVWGVKWCMH